jgi:uncharacterized FlaG/YvyC family protein
MKIESRVPEITRDPLSSENTGNSAGRPRSVTSDPIDYSARRASSTAPETSVKAIHVSIMNPPQLIDVKGAVEKLNKLVKSQRTNVSFSVDEDAHATVIKIFKTETGELIKQFPPEEILAMKAKISKSVGWLYDSKA